MGLKREPSQSRPEPIFTLTTEQPSQMGWLEASLDPRFLQKQESLQSPSSSMPGTVPCGTGHLAEVTIAVVLGTGEPDPASAGNSGWESAP